MIQHIWADFWTLAPETKVMVVAQVAGFIIAIWRAFKSSKKATFFEKAHEAVVIGIEKSDCDDCKKFAKEEAEKTGIAAKVAPIIKAITQDMVNKEEQASG